MSIVIGLIILLICATIFSTHYRLKKDFDNKIFHDYLWLLGIKHGDKRKFDNIEYLFIKQSHVTQTMNLRVASSTIKKEVFDGYLKFSENEKIHLITRDNKEDLINKLREISNKLKVKLIDYSDGEPKEI